MTGEEMGLKLKGCRERLCVVQTHVALQAQRDQLQTAIDCVDRVGVMVDPQWSKYAEPGVDES